MSFLAGEPRIQDVIDAVRGSTKCRIPQRQQPGRSRPPFNNVSRPRGEPAKQKIDVTAVQHNRFAAKSTTRPRFDEQIRPKSANKAKDDLLNQRCTHTAKYPRTDRYPAPKRPSTLPKLSVNETAVMANKTARTLIMVPVTQRPPAKNLHTIKNTTGVFGLPDQATIKKQEDLELRQSEISDATQIFNDSYDKESITSRSDKAMKLKISLQEKRVQFEKLKDDLTNRQRAILELYAVMRNTHQQMSALGEKSNLPSAEDLKIMNVTKMTPEQLMQLCSGSASFGGDRQSLESACKSDLMIDVQKLYNMPSKIIDTCEQTLVKRKEIIDWFDSLKSVDKGISVHSLSKKINEFNAENEMLKCTLDQVKAEFVKELEEIVSFLRKSVNETMATQLRCEGLTYEMSELNSQNADLRKQMQTSDYLRSQTNKTRVEELQKELKEEKCKRIFLKDRLSRAEGQVKMNQERATQLEAALEQARSQTRTLERTVQQLTDHNRKLQDDFDKELETLTESIKEHTVHLEEIAEAKEKLQTEKEDLEKRLTEIADDYNVSLKDIKHENNLNVAKLIDREKKYAEQAEEKNVLEEKVASLCAQLTEAELRIKDLSKQLQDRDNEIGTMTNLRKELETTKQELDDANLKIMDYKTGLQKQNEVIAEIERSYKESKDLQQTMACDISTKKEYIAELENKHALLEQQLQDNESKMKTYVDQLTSLKTQIIQLQEDFGEFENLDEIHEKVNVQRAQLLEVTRQNGELAEALQKKEEELENLSASFADQENNLEQQERVIKMLSEKEEEQTNVIQLLRNNLELRTQTDANFNLQVREKNSEIDALISELNMNKQQMSKLENIILTLEDQTRKASIQRKKDQDKIAMLQSKVAEYEQFQLEKSRIIDAPTENLDNLLKMIEDELCTTMDSQVCPKDQEYVMTKRKHIGDRKREKLELQEEINKSFYPNEPADKFPRENHLLKKPCASLNEKQYEIEQLDRKKAIIRIDNQKWKATPPGVYNHSTRETILSNVKELPGEHNKLMRNLQHMAPSQFRDDRKCKMYKLAGHRL